MQPINANNFELKPALISMVQQNQFGGHSSEDPNGHMAYFLELAHSVKVNGVLHDEIKMSLFRFSLKRRQNLGINAYLKGLKRHGCSLFKHFLLSFSLLTYISN